MPANWPTSADTFATDQTDATLTATRHAAEHVQYAEVLAALEAELGLNPSGASATVAARFAALVSSAPVDEGTSFPGSPSAKQLFLRTDQNILYRRNDANSAWAKVGVTDLVDMAERDHASLQNVGADDHHPEAHAYDDDSLHVVSGRKAGEVLASVTSTTMDWIYPLQRHFGAGVYYAPDSPGNVQPTALILNTPYAVPFLASTETNFDTASINVTTGGGAASGAVVRMGIYTDNGTQYPGTLVLDFGTVNSEASGAKAKAITLPGNLRGLYWLVTVAQAVTCSVSAYTISNPLIGSTSAPVGTALVGYKDAAAATPGALPGTWTATRTTEIFGPRVSMKAV